jgi:hypothetical protein
MRSAGFILGVFLVFVSRLMMSCVSTDPAGKQKEVLLAFEEVYSSYKTDFILDDARIYTVAEGDTLPAVIRQIYGADNGYFFPLVVLASGGIVVDTGVLEPGMVLNIPNLHRNLDDPDTRQSLKYFLYDVAAVYEKKEAAETQEYKKQQAADFKNRLRGQADAL